MNVAFIALPKYLSNDILGCIAREMGSINTCFYLETNEESRKDYPDVFKNLIEIDGYKVRRLYSLLSCGIVKNIFNVARLSNNLRREIYTKLDLNKIDVVITTSDMGGIVTRICNDWAEKNDKLFITMQPCFFEVVDKSLYEKLLNTFFYYVANKLCRIPIRRRQHIYGCERKTNFLLLWGEDFKSNITDKNILEKTMCVGNPVLDRFKSAEVKINLHSKPTVLFCTQPYTRLIKDGILDEGDDLLFFNLMLTMVRDNPSVEFLIRVHPSEDIQTYVKLFESVDTTNYQIIKTTTSIYEMFKEVDVQVSMASYTSFEAIMFGIPIITLYPEKLKFCNHLDKSVSLISHSCEELNKNLKIALSKKYREKFAMNREKYIKRKVYYFGKSADVIHAVIYSLAVSKIEM